MKMEGGERQVKNQGPKARGALLIVGFNLKCEICNPKFTGGEA
jgi:hypothetical protein